jgi:hypothetical protein
MAKRAKLDEARWLSSREAWKMISSLLHKPTSERKYRLMALAFAQPWRAKMVDERSCRAIDTAERFADGLATVPELEAAKLSAWRAWEECPGGDRERVRAAWVAGCCAWKSARRAAIRLALPGRENPEAEGQARLVRDIIGNPFQTVAVAESWLAWSDREVWKLAQGIYEERAFDRLPVLADALEEAGCDNGEILSHCREPGQHMRGCWVVDLLIGRT